MQVKTVSYKLNVDGIKFFDKDVNKYLSEGWRLVKGEVINGSSLGNGVYFSPCLYAELVQLDEPEISNKLEDQLDPIEALRIVRDYCANRPVSDNGVCKGCKLEKFCSLNEAEKTPHLWEIPFNDINLKYEIEKR